MAKKRASVEEEVYEVEKIVAYREEENGQGRWRVRWRGYTADDDTWEPIQNIMADDKRIRAEMEKAKEEFFKEKKPTARTSAAKAKTSPKASPRKVIKDTSKISKKSTGQLAASPSTKSKKSDQAEGPGGECKVAHVRRYNNRQDDYECTVVWSNGYTEHMLVSEVRKNYPEPLFDYLLHRIKFVESSPSKRK